MHIQAAELAVGPSPGSTVIVIGAGPVGLSIAHELADGGIDVMVLERGLLSHPKLPPDKVDEIRQNLVYRGEYPSRYFEVFGVGGASRVWLIQTPRGGRHVQMVALDESDFAISPPGSPGWPISYSEHAAYFDRAARHCGLPAWEPLPEEMTWPELIGTESVPVRSVPSAHFWKGEAEFMASSPRVRLVTGACVTRLVVGDDGRSINGVRVASRPGQEFTVEADFYVLALGGVENPRLLLCSPDSAGRVPGNASGLVGQYFMEHPHYRSGYLEPSDPALLYDEARFEKRVSDRVIQQTKLVLTLEERRAHGLPNVSYSFGPAVMSMDQAQRELDHHPLPQLAAFTENSPSEFEQGGSRIGRTAARVYGRALTRLRRLVDRKPRIFKIHSIAEQYPHEQNRVLLSRERDEFGMPRPNVEWSPTVSDLRAMAASQRRLAELLAASGLGRMFSGMDRGWVPRMTIGPHYMGSTRMAASEADGVVDPDCRVFGLDNLYVAGSSTFPTGGSANPTFSAIALGVRLADHLLERLGHPRDASVPGPEAQTLP